ncbi:unnamed protein product, partial [Prorocentrum cordatum]
ELVQSVELRCTVDVSNDSVEPVDSSDGITEVKVQEKKSDACHDAVKAPNGLVVGRASEKDDNKSIGYLGSSGHEALVTTPQLNQPPQRTSDPR